MIDFPLKGRGIISGLVSCRVSEEGAYFCSKASPSSGRRQGDLLESTLHAWLDQVWTQPLDHQGVLLLLHLSKVTPHPTYEPHYQAGEMAPGQSARGGSSRTGHAHTLKGGGQERISGREAANDKGTSSHSRWMTNTGIVL